MRHIANMEQEVKGEERAITHNSIPHGRLACVSHLHKAGGNTKVAKVLAFASFN